MCHISFFEFSVITMWLRKLWWMGCFFQQIRWNNQYFAGLKIKRFSILGIRRVIHHVLIQPTFFLMIFPWNSHEIMLNPWLCHGYSTPSAMTSRQDRSPRYTRRSSRHPAPKGGDTKGQPQLPLNLAFGFLADVFFSSVAGPDMDGWMEIIGDGRWCEDHEHEADIKKDIHMGIYGIFRIAWKTWNISWESDCENIDSSWFIMIHLYICLGLLSWFYGCYDQRKFGRFQKSNFRLMDRCINSPGKTQRRESK